MKYKQIYPWLLIVLLWGVGLLNYLDRQMLATMRPAMQSSIAELQSATNFGILMGIFLWVYGFMSPVAGMIADKINKKWLIIISLFVWSGVTFGMGYATTYRQLYWLRAVMGISEALYLPSALALIANFHREGTRSLAIGIHMTGLYVGTSLGGFGATVAAAYSWRVTFHSFGLIGMAYSLVLILFLKGKNDSEKNLANTEMTLKPKPSLFSGLDLLFSNLSFWIILLSFAVPSLPSWATKNWLPTLFSQKLNLPMSEAGPLATITISVSQFMGVIGGGILSDRWVRKNVRGRIYTSAIGLLFTIPSLLLLGFGRTFFDFILAGLCFGIGFGMFDANNMPILCQFISPQYRATAYGLMNMSGILSGAFITELLGKYADGGHLGKSFAMLSLVVLVVIVIQLTLLRPRVNDFVEKS
ncbi:MAG: MFS transporter [Acidobacterium ailaaui]|nr:MFS transporter [Pseudacidobacterium ailaaui]